jgi:formate hydrogenlyase transcriptional activator
MHRPPPLISESVWQALEGYHWPGNIRELENFIERALILCPEKNLSLSEPPGGGGRRPPASPSAAPPGADIQPFDEVVRQTLSAALHAADGKIYGKDGAAALLGLKPTTFQGKLRKYGLQRNGLK